MKTVVLINEESHGLIGIAKDYESALLYLFNDPWIDDRTEVCVGDDEHLHNWAKVSEVLGEDWRDKIMGWDIPNFNDFWEGSFYLSTEEVIGTE